MKERIAGLVLACAVVFLSATPALAQTSSLSGVVVDSNGGILPGVTVVVKNVATGTTFDAVTNTEGVFSVPALDAGAYTVTASLSGFKTAVGQRRAAGAGHTGIDQGHARGRATSRKRSSSPAAASW